MSNEKRKSKSALLIGIFLLLMAIYFIQTETVIGRGIGILSIDDIGDTEFWLIVAMYFSGAVGSIIYSIYLRNKR